MYLFLFFLLLLPRPASALITEIASQRIGQVATTAVDSTSQTTPGAVTLGNLLVVLGVADLSPTAIVVTAPCVATFTISTAMPGTERVFIAYGAITTGGSTCTVTVNPTGSNDKMYFNISEYSGVNATPLDGTVVSNSGTSTAPTASITTTFANDVVVAFMTHTDNTNVVITPGSGWTEIKELESTTGLVGSGIFQIVTTTATYTPNWTLASSQPWLVITAAFRPSTTASSGQSLRRRALPGA